MSCCDRCADCRRVGPVYIVTEVDAQCDKLAWVVGPVYLPVSDRSSRCQRAVSARSGTPRQQHLPASVTSVFYVVPSKGVRLQPSENI